MIVILGATGLVGSHLKMILKESGREVWSPNRQDLALLSRDDSCEQTQRLIAYFVKAKIVINTLGIAPGFGDQRQKDVYWIQKNILEIALEYKIPKIISFSALSRFTDSSKIPYLRYKYQLDEMVLNSPCQNPFENDCDLQRYIIKPSLIFDPKGKSTQFFKLLSKAPLLFLPKSAIRSQENLDENSYKVAPIILSDLLEFVMTLITRSLPSGTFELGSHTYLMSEYLRLFNPSLKTLSMPEPIFSGMMSLLKPIFPGVAGKYAFALLRAGSTPISDDFERVMGRKTMPIDSRLMI